MAFLEKRTGKWLAREYCDGRRVYLGAWDSLEEAAEVESQRRIYACFEQEFILAVPERSGSRVMVQ